MGSAIMGVSVAFCAGVCVAAAGVGVLGLVGFLGYHTVRWLSESSQVPPCCL